MPLRRPLPCLLLAMLAGSAAAQQANRVPTTAEVASVRTSLGAMKLTIANPAARESLAAVQDLSPGKPGVAADPITLTSRVYVQASDEALRALTDAGYVLTPAPAGFVTIDTGSIASANELVHAIADMPGVASASVEARAELGPRNSLNDEFYPLAWHLFNEDSEGHDVNAEGAWKMGYTGQGITIGVIDSGVYGFHPDMAGKRNADLTQAGPSSFHGTGVAGIAVAIGDNEEGAAGIAHGADYGSLYYSASGVASVNAEAFARRNDIADIKNNSWGPFDNGQLRSISDIENEALITAATTGRDGKGTIFVWAAGNGGAADRVDYDPYASSPYTIAIGAITHEAERASYSERGSSLFAVTYSDGSGRSIVSTANSSSQPYTFNFGGTSAAAPLASGLIALCLEANPDLTWRDVQHLIVEAAEPVDEADADWTTNGAGIPINHNYGFGQLDAVRMVNAALNWSPVAPQVMLDAGVIEQSIDIPDNDPAGIDIPFEVTDNIVIEHVIADIAISGTYIGDLQITLTSPDGTASILHTQHNNSADEMDHIFHSVRTWGEQAAGTWTLNIADLAEQDTHTLTRFALSFLGTEFDCPADQDGDNVLTTDDFLAWLTNYQNGDMQADLNGNGTLEPADFSAWVQAYNTGC